MNYNGIDYHKRSEACTLDAQGQLLNQSRHHRFADQERPRGRQGAGDASARKLRRHFISPSRLRVFAWTHPFNTQPEHECLARSREGAKEETRRRSAGVDRVALEVAV